MEVTLRQSLALPISAGDSSQIGHARRRAVSMAISLGFDDLAQGQVGIVVTEAASNIAAHGGSGEIVLSPWRFQGGSGIDVLALDSGKGIADLGRSLEDGFSTAGTHGEGLGAMSRLASTLQVYSVADHGTALFARLLAEAPTEDTFEYNLGAICVPIAGETDCGDSWSADFSSGRSVYIVADGLGHGIYAAEASREAVRVFKQAPHLTPARILSDAHGALAKTRGAAISIAHINHSEGILTYAGVGNIAAAILHKGKSRSLVSMNGTIGHNIGRIQEFSYPWEKGSALVMHSDGLGTRWNLDAYPGLVSRHPALTAGVLYRDFCRKRDDVTILVTRI
jgi:anti-sigma regulatory factor (Ser/Thr protein kinase)